FERAPRMARLAGSRAQERGVAACFPPSMPAADARRHSWLLSGHPSTASMPQPVHRFPRRFHTAARNPPAIFDIAIGFDGAMGNGTLSGLLGSQIAFRLAVVTLLAVVVPGRHVYNLIALSGAAGLAATIDAALSRTPLASATLTAWDEATVFW